MTQSNNNNINCVSHSTHRIGKWTAEEERYADLLIESFLSGYLSSPINTPLKTFLASKLHCLPMRISKKFPGFHHLGLRYEQHQFCEEVLTARKNLLESYEMDYMLKDQKVQSQRFKRRKYTKCYAKSAMELCSDELSDLSGSDMSAFSPSKVHEDTTSSKMEISNFRGSEDYVDHCIGSKYSDLSNSQDASKKATVVFDEIKEYYSQNTITDLDNSQMKIDKINEIFMVLANAADTIEMKEQKEGGEEEEKEC